MNGIIGYTFTDEVHAELGYTFGSKSKKGSTYCTSGWSLISCDLEVNYSISSFYGLALYDYLLSSDMGLTVGVGFGYNTLSPEVLFSASGYKDKSITSETATTTSLVYKLGYFYQNYEISYVSYGDFGEKDKTGTATLTAITLAYNSRF